MAALQKFRLKTRSSLAGPLAEHVLGERRPWNAIKREGLDAVDYYDEDGLPTKKSASMAMRYQANEYLVAKKAERRAMALRGRPPGGVLDVMAAGPEFDETTEDERRRFVYETVQFFRRGLGPNSKIAMATAHNDELKFHVHVYCVCVGDDEMIGWMRSRNRLADLPCDEFPDPAQLGEREYLSRLQDVFHEHVSSKFGIGRGHRFLKSGENPNTYSGGPDRAKSLYQRGFEDGGKEKQAEIERKMPAFLEQELRSTNDKWKAKLEILSIVVDRGSDVNQAASF